jgi:RHS repeat-associated protein
VEPDSTQWKITRGLLYDGWGNVNSESTTGIGMAARTTTASYAATSGRFLSSVTNALSQTTQLGWDATIGTLTSMTDPNSLVTSWQYDVFGRRTREDRPDSTATTLSYHDCSGVAGGCVNSNNKMVVIATELDDVDGFVSDQWTYFDKLDRPLVTKSRMLSGSYNRIERQYDIYGNLSQEAAPCWAAACTAYWTAFTYDLLNRAKNISRPTSDSDPTAAVTNIHFEGLTTRTVDALGKQSTKIGNVLGGLAKSIDHDGYAQLFDVDGFGNVVRVTDSLSNTLQSITYNVQGVKTAQTDMDMGAWTYLPNALGELEKIRDAKTVSPNWTTIMTYDPLGRMTSRQDVPEGVTSNWTWGAAIHNDATHKYIGGLKSLSGGGYSETYTNDDKGRRATTQIVSDATYLIDYAYNSIGQLDTLTYPTSTAGYRLKLQYEYQNGWLKRVKDFNAPTTEFWTANDTDPRGNVINETLENGLQTIRGFDLVTGLLDSIVTGPGGSGTIQNLSYAWDKVGNLTQRQDVRQSLTETFSYDNLHRLTSSTGPDPITITYNSMGNIQTKTGIAGTYSYHATKKHAVTAAGSFTFAYDANGNMSSRNGSTICWFSYNLPKVIGASGSCTGQSNSSQFFYAPDRSRWKQVAKYGGTTETTIYIGGLIEKVTRGAATSWRHYIAGGSGAVALYTRKSGGGADEMHYLTRDHLGSVDSVTNGSGAVEVRLSYGAFGQRRKEAGWSGNPTSGDWTEITDTTRRGFTFHEMLDNLNLTHMNGRVYDQIVGRFISADPFIPEPGITQSFNRYSYVRNNPLTFTDPSGFYEDRTTQRISWIDQIAHFPGMYFGSLEGRMAIEDRRWAFPVGQTFPADSNPSDEQPAPDPIDQHVDVSATSCPKDFMPCGHSTTLEPSYAHRAAVAARGLATGLFAVALNLVAIQPEAEHFTDFGLTLYDDPVLAEDFQNGHNFGYALGFWSTLGLAGVSTAGRVTAPPALATTAARSVGHHADPKFLGGARNQSLTRLAEETHKNLHRDMNDFLRTRMDELGNHMRPQRGNSGQVIRQNFSRQERLEALRDFYRGPGAKYTDAAHDFFSQHPGL